MAFGAAAPGHGYARSARPPAASSHSASDGRRRPIHAQYPAACLKLTQLTGLRALSVESRRHMLPLAAGEQRSAATHFAYAATVTSCCSSANGATVARTSGRSAAAPVDDPSMNTPPGSSTSGESATAADALAAATAICGSTVSTGAGGGATSALDDATALGGALMAGVRRSHAKATSVTAKAITTSDATTRHALEDFAGAAACCGGVNAGVAGRGAATAGTGAAFVGAAGNAGGAGDAPLAENHA